MKNKRNSLLLFLFILFQGEVIAQISNPVGDLQPVDDNDIWAQTLEGSHYNELWSYHFYLNGDMKVVITFSAANFGSLKSPVSGVQVSIDRIDGNLYQLSREYSIEHLVQDKETFMFRNRAERELYFVGKLPDEHRIIINTSKDGLPYEIDLKFHNIQEGVKWRDGNFMIHGEKVGIITHIPYADVSGKISVDGYEEKVSGTVYMDHTFQNQTTTRLIDSGFRFIHHQDPQNWDLVYFMLPDDSDEQRTIGYRLKNTDGNITVNGVERILQINKSDTFGEDLARIIEVELDDGSTIRLTRTEDSEKFSVLSELGRIAKSVAKRFLGGEVIHFRGNAVLMESGQRPIHGYYHYLIVD